MNFLRRLVSLSALALASMLSCRRMQIQATSKPVARSRARVNRTARQQRPAGYELLAVRLQRLRHLPAQRRAPPQPAYLLRRRLRLRPSSISPPEHAIPFDSIRISDQRSSQPGDSFPATVADDVMVNGQIVIPSGARAEGTVVDAKAARQIQGRRLPCHSS